jgi:hypothetical protein
MWKEHEISLEKDMFINLSKKFALYFTKKCIKNKLFDEGVSRFKKLAQNPQHPEILCMFITYDSFTTKMVILIILL